MRDWADEDKPREKLMSLGKKALSDAELVAILLGSGSAGESAVELAKKLLASADNDLNTLRNHGINDLTLFKGIGKAKAVTITAALELGYRLISQASASKRIKVSDSRDIFKCIAPPLIDLPHEEFWALMLNAHNQVIGRALIARGGREDTGVDVRIVFKKALESGACYIAVAHNHPSGVLYPSRADRELTARLLASGKVLNIQLLDHLIVGIDEEGRASYYSFHDKGLL